QLGGGDADEAGRQPALRDESVARTRRDGADRASDLDVLRQIEVVSSGLSRSLSNPDVAVVRKAGNDGIDRMVRQVLGERCGVRGVDRMRGEVWNPVRAHDGLGGSAVHIAQMNLVTAGFRKQSGDECADLAGPENEYTMHRVPSKKCAIIMRFAQT